MASQANGKSKLAQMQMRFQQKQQVERDQRRTELSGGRNFALLDSTESKKLASSLGAGKVRQMFDERRNRSSGVGIDKSYPLQPISIKSTDHNSNHKSKSPLIKTNKPPDTDQGVNEKYSESSLHENETILNNNNYTNSNVISNVRTIRKQMSGMTITTNNNNVKLKPISDVKPTESITKSLNSKPRLSQIRSGAKPTTRLSTATRSSMDASSSSASSTKSPTSSASPTKTPRTVNNSASLSGKRSLNDGAGSSLNNSSPDPNSCKFCGRRFNEDRIAKHESICQMTKIKKRKIFDATKHRVKGTDAEQFVKKTAKQSTTKKSDPILPRKGDWRRKHLEFIQAIRSAKEMQAHLARGGKLSDLPPPPPSENPDYVQCPHCMRKFNQGAAERHIPKCATFKHNKPKPNATKPASKSRY